MTNDQFLRKQVSEEFETQEVRTTTTSRISNRDFFKVKLNKTGTNERVRVEYS